MDTKYQIFISSTYEDLQKERKAIIDQILQVGHIPEGMEMFVAGNEEDFQVIQRKIDQSDIFVILVGARFGTKTWSGESYTEREFKYAQNIGKPILAFFLDEEDVKTERSRFIVNNPERREDDNFLRFREEVKRIDSGKQRLVGYFKKDDCGSLKAMFVPALNELICNPEFKMLGWIHASEELLSLGPVSKDPFIRKIIEKLKEYDLLTKRSTTVNIAPKKCMASYFWDRCLAGIIDLKIMNLFFESGSTIAYLSSEFIERLKNPSGEVVVRDLRIKTNNILTYLEFVLSMNIQIELIPFGPPEKRYGATFGDLSKLPGYFPPDPNPLLKNAKDAIKKMAQYITGDSKNLLILATASGLNLSQMEYPLGPHIGSYYNKLFKRALLETKCPMVLFVDGAKIDTKDDHFDLGHCFSVCDSDISWEKICEEFPLALCIGAKSEEQQKSIINQIQPYGFIIIDPIDTSKKYDCYPILARNKLFNDFLPCLELKRR